MHNIKPRVKNDAVILVHETHQPSLLKAQQWFISFWAANDRHRANLLNNNDVAATVANATVKKKEFILKRTPIQGVNEILHEVTSYTHLCCCLLSDRIIEQLKLTLKKERNLM